MVKTNKRQFTLVELMTVLIVILLLAGTVIMVGPIVTKLSNDAKTKSLIQSISLALEAYKASGLSGGAYPVSRPPRNTRVDDEDDGSFTEVSYQPFYLDKYRTNAPDDDPENPNNNMVQFFDLEKIADSRNYNPATRTYYLLDAYKTPLIYRSPGRFHPEAFDLISLGQNGYAGNSDKTGWGLEKIGSTIDLTNTNAMMQALSFDDNAAEFLGQGDDITN